MFKQKRLIGLFVLLVCLVFSTGVMAFDLAELGLKESYDLNGNTVTIISWTAERIENYLREDPVTIGRIEEAEKLFNCKIEFLQTRDIPATNFNRLLAGESAYDLWFTQSRIGYYELVSQGAAYPMSEVLSDKYYDSLSAYEKDSIELLSYYGSTYGIGKMHFGSGAWNTGGIVMFYNKTLIDEAGVADPYDLYLNDQWTWDVATEMMRELTIDRDGDGTTDVYAIADPVPESFIISNGGSVTKVDENGRIIFALDEINAIEGLELYADWSNRGFFGGKFENRTAAFRMRFLNDGSKYLELSDEWGVVPFPRGPRANTYYFPEWSPETTIIPVNSANPEAMAALRAFLFRQDDVPVNLVMARTVKSKEAADVFMELQNNWEPTARNLFETFIGDLVSQAFKDIRDNVNSPAVIVAQIKNQAQAALDDFQAGF